MEVRKAYVTDLDQILDLCRRIHPTTSYADIPMDERSVRALVLGGISAKGQVAYICLVKNQVTGLLIGGVQSFPWNGRVFFASDDLLIAEKGGAYLLRRFIRWAKSKPRVKEIILGESAGAAVAGEMYQAAGFTRAGGMYRMKV